MALGPSTTTCSLVYVEVAAIFKAMIIEKVAADTRRAQEQRTPSALKASAAAANAASFSRK